LALVTAPAEHGGQRVTKRNRVPDPGVHALSAGWAVDVCRVARDEDPAGAVALRDSVMHAEPGAPDDFVYSCRPRLGPSRVQETLHVSDPRVLRRVVHRGHDPVAP